MLWSQHRVGSWMRDVHDMPNEESRDLGGEGEVIILGRKVQLRSQGRGGEGNLP